MFHSELFVSADLKEGQVSNTLDTPTGDAELQDYETGGVSLMDDDIAGGPATDTGLPFGMQVDSYAEGTIKSLLEERDAWKAQAESKTRALEQLERRVYKKTSVDIDFPTEMVRRLNKLESYAERYRTENEDLRKALKIAESEVASLQDEIRGQKNKLKGAGKKTRNAKDNAGKQEDKAKAATHDKKL